MVIFGARGTAQPSPHRGCSHLHRALPAPHSADRQPHTALVAPGQASPPLAAPSPVPRAAPLSQHHCPQCPRERRRRGEPPGSLSAALEEGGTEVFGDAVADVQAERMEWTSSSIPIPSGSPAPAQPQGQCLGPRPYTSSAAVQHGCEHLPRAQNQPQPSLQAALVFGRGTLQAAPELGGGWGKQEALQLPLPRGGSFWSLGEASRQQRADGASRTSSHFFAF